MTEEEYWSIINEMSSGHLEHAAKGSSWKNHKYIRIENGRYIYPEDEKSGSNKSSDPHVVGGNQEKGAAERMQNKAYNDARNAGRKETVRQQAVNEASKMNDKLNAYDTAHGTNGTKSIYGNIYNMVYVRDDVAKSVKDKNLGAYGINPIDVLNEAARKVDSKSYSNYARAEMKELKGREAMNKAKTDAKQATDDYKKHLEEEKAKGEVKKQLDLHESAALEWKKHKDEALKKEQQPRQEETKKITSLSPDEARKRAAEITKTKEAEAARNATLSKTGPNAVSAYNEFRKYVPDSSKDWNDEIQKLSDFLKEKGPSLNANERNAIYQQVIADRKKAADDMPKMPKGESLSKQMDFDAEEKRINGQLEKQDKNGVSISTETSGKNEQKSGWSATPPSGFKNKTDLPDERVANIVKEVGREKTRYAKLAKGYDLTEDEIVKAALIGKNEYKEMKSVAEDSTSRQAATIRGGSVKKTVDDDGTTHLTVVNKSGKEFSTYSYWSEDAYIKENMKEASSKKKIKHSFDSRDEFYAAVDNYKQEHKIEHHGILGQKWGIRRYQNPDGTLTDLGRKHQGKLDKIDAKIEKLDSKTWKSMAKYVEKNGTTVGYDLSKDRAWNKAEKLLNKKALLSIKAHANDKLADMYDKDPECKQKVDSLIRANKSRRMNQLSTQFLFGIPGSVVYNLITAPFEARDTTRAYVSGKAREAFDKAASESDYGKRVSIKDREKYANKAGYDYRK